MKLKQKSRKKDSSADPTEALDVVRNEIEKNTGLRHNKGKRDSEMLSSKWCLYISVRNNDIYLRNTQK